MTFPICFPRYLFTVLSNTAIFVVFYDIHDRKIMTPHNVEITIIQTAEERKEDSLKR